MNELPKIVPKERINSIDALRGFALMGILLLHCMEHFDLMYRPVLESPLWQWIDTAVYKTLYFLFQGKSYAIFSLLFGLSFFMMMDSQAQKGKDFRGRFIWRLFILLIFGYINGLIYMGEFFVIYAVLGIILVPLWKLPTKWLLVLSVLLFLQIPQIVQFISLLGHNVPNEPTAVNIRMNRLFYQSADVFANGSFADVIRFNLAKGQFAKLLWFVDVHRYVQLAGLFIAGMLIGRAGIHKSKEKMMYYSRKTLPYAVACFALFYAVALLLPSLGVEGYSLRVGRGLFKLYANLGMMMIYICGFTLLYYNTIGGRKALDRLAPVGRMSVTNYMAQSLMGTFVFYGWGLGLAMRGSFLQCALAGIVILLFQIWYSNWWIKRYYYGPMEWLWRMLTWFRRVPMKR